MPTPACLENCHEHPERPFLRFHQPDTHRRDHAKAPMPNRAEVHARRALARCPRCSSASPRGCTPTASRSRRRISAPGPDWPNPTNEPALPWARTYLPPTGPGLSPSRQVRAIFFDRTMTGQPLRLDARAAPPHPYPVSRPDGRSAPMPKGGRGGKSGLHGRTVPDNVRRGRPLAGRGFRDSATENRPPGLRCV